MDIYVMLSVGWNILEFWIKFTNRPKAPAAKRIWSDKLIDIPQAPESPYANFIKRLPTLHGISSDLKF